MTSLHSVVICTMTLSVQNILMACNKCQNEDSTKFEWVSKAHQRN